MSVLTVPQLKRVAVERPITTLSVIAIGLTLPLQTTLLLARIDLFIGKLAELVLLTGTAALITWWIGGAVRTGTNHPHRPGQRAPTPSGRSLVDTHVDADVDHIPSRSFDPNGTS
jgi:hypothetical protein